MTILQKLSSQCGDKTEASNKAVARQCLQEPALLEEIAAALGGGDAVLAGDCAEVMTMTAEEQPHLVAPYASHLAANLHHKNTRLRWETVHSLALVAELNAAAVKPLVPELPRMFQDDKSVIVRDWIIQLAAAYAKSGLQNAREVYPMLKDALTAWDGKQAAHALAGLANVAARDAGLRQEIIDLITPYLEQPRPVMKKAARAAMKLLKSQ